MKVALVLIIKNENKYIKEFLTYYQDLGIDTVFLCDNNDIDGETPLDIIGEYIKNGFVKYINARGKTAYQREAYTSIYNEIKYDYNWICFLDTDEFLTINEPITLKKWLSQEKFANANQIMINWVQFGDNDILDIKNDNYSVLDRFKKPCVEYGMVPLSHPINMNQKFFPSEFHVKSILRGGLEDIVFESAHFAKIDNNVNINGDKVSLNTKQLPCDKQSVVINHYVTKTLEEYLLRCENDAEFGVNAHLINTRLLSFFSKSYYSDQKLKIIQKKYPWFSYRPDLYNSPIDIIINYNNIGENLNDLLSSIQLNMNWVRYIYIIMEDISIIDLTKYDNNDIKFAQYDTFVPEKFLYDPYQDVIDMFIWKLPNLSEKFIYFFNVKSIQYPCFEEEFFPANNLNLHPIQIKDIHDKYRYKCFNNTYKIMRLLNIESKDFGGLRKFYIYDPYYIPMLKSDCETCFNFMRKNMFEKKDLKYFTPFNKYIYPTWSFIMRHYEDCVKLTDFYMNIMYNMNNDDRIIYKII